MVFQYATVELCHCGRYFIELVNLAALMGGEGVRIGLRGEGCKRGAHRSARLRSHDVERGAGIDPVALRRIPVCLGHVLHVHGAHVPLLFRAQHDREQLDGVAEDVRGALVIQNLRLRAGEVSHRHAIEAAGRIPREFDRTGRRRGALAAGQDDCGGEQGRARTAAQGG